jgi:hypothetical protein
MGRVLSIAGRCASSVACRLHRAVIGQKETFDEQGRIADNPPSEQMHGALDLASKGYATKLQTA